MKANHRCSDSQKLRLRLSPTSDLKTMSRGGFVLCVMYAAVIVLCFVMALLAKGDFKGWFVMLQLPIALQAAALESVGLGLLLELEHLSWVSAYFVIGLPTFALLYAMGWLIERLFRSPRTFKNR